VAAAGTVAGAGAGVAASGVGVDVAKVSEGERCNRSARVPTFQNAATSTNAKTNNMTVFKRFTLFALDAITVSILLT
jgi:hypothetical protein